jgi:soluble lytic murein transglycosylase
MKLKLLLLAGLLALTACNVPQQIANLPAPLSLNTATPAASPTPEPTLTPSPSPTPIPAVRVEAGEQALFSGDYTKALEEFSISYQTGTEPGIQAAALWGSARIEYLNSNYAGALDLIRELITTYPDTLEATRGYFLMGKTLDALQRYTEAADAYGQYVARRPGSIDAYAQEARGDALSNAGDYSGALAAYQAALSAPQLGEGLGLNRKIAQMYLNLGSTEQAMGIYTQVSQNTTNDYVKAEMDLLTGRVHLLRGESDLAYEKFLHAVQNYPLAYDSYSALIALVEAGVPVSDLDRGLVDYYAGQNGLALAAFDRYLQNIPPEDDGTVYHYRALTLRALGNNEEAIASWTKLIDNYPQNRYWTTAWDEKATTQWAYLDDYNGAAQTLLDFITKSPTAPEAADYLYTAGRIYERADRLADAAKTWERVANEYAQSTNAIESLHQAGIARYRLNDYDGANTDFQRVLLLANDPGDQARANFWIGKTLNAKGDTAGARSAWERAQLIDPTGYYSERASDLINNRQPFQQPIGYSLGVNLPAERMVADTWVRVNFNLPPETDLSGAGALAQDPRFIRGAEFWSLGMYDLANNEFVNLRESVKDNAADSYRLGNVMLEMGIYRQAIYAIRQTLTLAGLDEHYKSLEVPAYFNHVRYGLYFSDIIEPTARENDFDPMFLYSVIRQESLFDAAARSGADARGLMQIITSTGEATAQAYGWPKNYTSNDLYNPLVNIRLGTYYLATNRNALNGDLYAALAAYNGGPGNAAIWKDIARDDPDLFVEVVRYAETRDYIRYIYEAYNIYKSFYSPMQ